MNDTVRINALILILKIIVKYVVKHIMILLDKNGHSSYEGRDVHNR